MAGVANVPDIAVREGGRSRSKCACFGQTGGSDVGTHKEGKWHHGDFYTLRKVSRGSDFQLYNTGVGFVFAEQHVHHKRGKDLISGGVRGP